MKVKFLKNGSGIGLGYFTGDEATLSQEQGEQAVKAGIAEEVKISKAEADKQAKQTADKDLSNKETADKK
jgi:hypothetical protein